MMMFTDGHRIITFARATVGQFISTTVSRDSMPTFVKVLIRPLVKAVNLSLISHISVLLNSVSMLVSGVYGSYGR